MWYAPAEMQNSPHGITKLTGMQTLSDEGQWGEQGECERWIRSFGDGLVTPMDGSTMVREPPSRISGVWNRWS